MMKFLLRWFGSPDPDPEPDPTPDPPTNTAIRHYMTIDGMAREYYLYVPSTGVIPRTLVVAFHGGRGDAMRFATKQGLLAMADRHSFAIAIPQGARRASWSPRSWNCDSINPSGWAEKKGIDDLKFLTWLIADVRSLTSIKPDVCLMGMSKGGMFAYHAATHLPHIDAIGVVAGTMSTKTPLFATARLLHIHGRDDTRVPVDGNDKWPPISRGIDYFTEQNGSDMVDLEIFAGGHEWPSHATEDIAESFE